MVQRTLLFNPSVLDHPTSPPGNLDLSTTAPSHHTTASPCMFFLGMRGTEPTATDHIPAYLWHPVHLHSMEGLYG